MAFDPKAWFIGLAGVEHSAELARMLAWVSTSGATGIIEPADLQVRAQTAPNGTVRIAPGGFVVKSRYSGANQQSYAGRAPSETELAIPATGESGGATRYVVVQVLDPDYPGGGSVPTGATEEEAEAAANAYTYVRPVVVSSLSGSRTEVPLAKIVQPKNTTAITREMITDIRKLSLPWRDSEVYSRPNVGSDTGQYLASRAKGGEWFPNGGNNVSFDIPEWCTRIIIRAKWLELRYDGRSTWGTKWIEFGDDYRAGGWEGPNGFDLEFRTQGFTFDVAEGMVQRNSWDVSDTVPMPAKLRGKSVQFLFKARLSESTTAKTDAVKCDGGSGLELEVIYLRKPTNADQG